jgi:two-component system chemotaxis response regulator CheB
MTVALPSESPADIADPVRVMVVDDSVLVRGLLSRWIAEEPGLAVVASLGTGRQALDHIGRTAPDVIVLDVDMPDLDGLSAVPLLLKSKPDVAVIMASTLTRRNAEITLAALSSGAADYVTKPESRYGLGGSLAFRCELIGKIRALGERRRRIVGTAASVAARRPSGINGPALELRPFPLSSPHVLAIGCSTGGPQALAALMPQLGPVLDRAPILIAQHMPPMFTAILAERLARISRRPAREASHGETVENGTIYVAPGGRHMCVEQREGKATIALKDGPPVRRYRPAVDLLLESAAAMWGEHVLALILTGMGTDGAEGAAAVAASGGCVIVQDERSSVVWGMPHAAMRTGACSAVLPLSEIAPQVVRLFQGERS